LKLKLLPGVLYGLHTFDISDNIEIAKTAVKQIES